MYNRHNQKSPLELLNVFGSLCSIIALIIVLCAEFHLVKTIVIASAFVVALCLTGWLFLGTYSIYRKIAEDWFENGTPVTVKLLIGVISIIVGLIVFVYAYKLSFHLTDWLVGIITETIFSLTTQQS